MNKERIVELLKNEAECIRRQDTPKCQRDELGCQGCDLLVETEEILEAYAEAVEIIQNARKVAYICDQKKECKDHCRPDFCTRTTDLDHALNFMKEGDAYFEMTEAQILKRFMDELKGNEKP